MIRHRSWTDVMSSEYFSFELSFIERDGRSWNLLYAPFLVMLMLLGACNMGPATLVHNAIHVPTHAATRQRIYRPGTGLQVCEAWLPSVSHRTSRCSCWHSCFNSGGRGIGSLPQNGYYEVSPCKYWKNTSLQTTTTSFHICNSSFTVIVPFDASCCQYFGIIFPVPKQGHFWSLHLFLQLPKSVCPRGSVFRTYSG